MRNILAAAYSALRAAKAVWIGERYLQAYRRKHGPLRRCGGKAIFVLQLRNDGTMGSSWSCTMAECHRMVESTTSPAHAVRWAIADGNIADLKGPRPGAFLHPPQ